MNRAAKEHLAKAKEYADRGEQFYRMAAEQMLAARSVEPLTWEEIARRVGRSADWCSRTCRWHEETEGLTNLPEDLATPWKADTPRRSRDAAKRVLREAPMEQVEQIVSSLPKERQQAIAAAAGNTYAKARQDYDEHEARLTPQERREREHAQDQIVRPVMQAVASFTTLGIIGHLEQAADELRELNADSSVTPDMTRKIERALDAFLTEFKFARALLGEEIE